MAEFDAQVGAEEALREQVQDLQNENQRLNQSLQQQHFHAQQFMGQQNQQFQNQFYVPQGQMLAPRPTLDLPPPSSLRWQPGYPSQLENQAHSVPTGEWHDLL